jgi:hypothetical protein
MKGESKSKRKQWMNVPRLRMMKETHGCSQCTDLSTLVMRHKSKDIALSEVNVLVLSTDRCMGDDALRHDSYVEGSSAPISMRVMVDSRVIELEHAGDLVLNELDGYSLSENTAQCGLV